MVSDLGKVLDPFADKLTQGTIMICLISRYPFILWLVILFAVKELIMFLMGYLTMKYAHSVNSAKWYGKACTVITLAAVITLILFPQLDIFWVKCIVGIDAAAIVLSLLLYIRFYRQVWQSKHAQMPIKISPELATRIKTGSVLTLVIGAIILESEKIIVLDVFCAALSVLSAYELYHNLNAGFNSILFTVLFGAYGIVLSFVQIPHYLRILQVCYPVFLAAVMFFLINIERLKGRPVPFHIPIALMIPLFFRAIPELRQFHDGLFLLLLTIGVPVLTDISAYFIGRRFGKRKLAPRISPNKTLAGSIGGTLTATVLLLLIAACFFPPAGIPKFAYLTLYLLSASLIGQIGDLLMSGVKRVIGIKDFSRLLPGHGGILDRFDSLLLVAPYTLIYASVILP